MRRLIRACVIAAILGSLPLLTEQTADARVMNPGDSLSMGSCLLSDNGSYGLCAHDINGGTGFYALSWSLGCSYSIYVIWNSHIDTHCSSGYGSHTDQSTSAGSDGFAQMQSDGNFVLYTSGGTARWATNTNGYGSSAFLNLQDDGNLVVYYNTNVPVWSLF